MFLSTFVSSVTHAVGNSVCGNATEHTIAREVTFTTTGTATAHGRCYCMDR